MPLGPKTAAYFKSVKKKAEGAPPPPPLTYANIQQVREDTVELFRVYAGPFPEGMSAKSFKDHIFQLPGNLQVRAKIYAPEGYNPDIGTTVIFFQGNGFVFDMIEAHLPGFARMANAANCQIIGIDTPLAPEYSPKQINDMSYAVIKQIFQYADTLNVNKDSIIVGGYSGGGNIAANAVNKARFDPAINIKHQLLLSPSLDMTLKTRIESPFAEYQDVDESATSESIKPILEMYYGTDDPSSPLISPTFTEHFTGVCPTTIIMAEYDGARGDGEDYALRLKKDGVEVKVLICKGQTHNYFIARGIMGDGEDPAFVMADAIKRTE